jgi:ABC-type lipopolysaccharide export system ATPase subunit
MASVESALPYSTPYDPAEDPPGSIDPLGTLGTSERLAETLLLLKRRGVSILLAEQNAALGLAVAYRGYILENGRTALEGSAADRLVDDHCLFVQVAPVQLAAPGPIA